MHKLINAIGQQHCELFFLTGSPSGEDLKKGYALSGSAERKIEEFLAPHRIKIREVWRSSVIKEKMTYNGPKRAQKKAAMLDTDMESWHAIIRKEIIDVNPSVIVPMDDIALECLIPRTEDMSLPRGRKNWISCFRGSIMPLRADWEINARVIPTFSPTLLNQYYEMHAIVGVDYKRIADNYGKRGAIKETGFCTVMKDPDQFRKWGNKYLLDPKTKFCTFDIETWGSLPTCISFCFDGYHAVSVPLMGYSDKMQAAMMWRLVAKILNHPVPKVNQNINYDWTILERFLCFVRNVVGDTMVAGHILYPEFPRGLDFYTSIYTEVPYYKDEGRDYDPTKHARDRLYLYNAKDSLVTHQIYTEQLKEIEERDLGEIYSKLVPLISCYKDMCARGMLRDETQRQKLITKYAGKLEDLLTSTRAIINDDKFNPGSPDQVGELIYEQLRFKKRTKKTKSGKVTYRTDKNTLDDLIISGAGNDFKRHILKRIILLRKLLKVIQYLNTPIFYDNVYRYSYNLTGTETGRSSGSKSLDQIFVLDKKKKWELRNVGGSPQTVSKHGFEIDGEFHNLFEDGHISRDLRSMYVPRKGYSLIEGDGSGAEARMVGVLSEDWHFMEHFDDKPKLHSRTAAQIWDVDPFEIDRNKKLVVPGLGIPYYDMGKRARHSGNYDVGAKMLSIMTHLEMSVTKVILEKFHAANPLIREKFHADIRQAINTNRTLRTPYGRERQFFGRIEDGLMKEAIAQIPQSTISDHTKFSIPLIKERMPSCHFLIEQHDGLLSEVPTDEEERYCKIFKEVYERPIDCRKGTLSRDYQLAIPAELSVSRTNWMELKEMKI